MIVKIWVFSIVKVTNVSKTYSNQTEIIRVNNAGDKIAFPSITIEIHIAESKTLGISDGNYPKTANWQHKSWRGQITSKTWKLWGTQIFSNIGHLKKKKKRSCLPICTFLFTFIHLLFVLLKTMVKYVHVYTGIFFPVFVYHPYTCKHPLVKKEICFKFT